MKQLISSILILCLCSLVVFSCNKAITEDPTHTLNGDSRFKTIADYEAALTGTYALLLQDGYYGSNSTNAFVTLPDIMSDNLFETGESLANYTELGNWNYTADDVNVQDLWLDAFAIIRQANLTLRGLDNIASENTGAVNRIKGQALALRAHVHFDLLRYFGEEYSRHSKKLGIPYVDVYDIEQKPARLTVEQSLDKIEADLHTAKELLSNTDAEVESLTSTSSSARSLVDTLVVDAMLARLYNYAGVPDSAIKYSSYVIGARPLALPTAFPNIWTDVTTEEVIWSVKFQAFNSGTGSNVYYPVNNRASYRPTENLMALYHTASDVRYPTYYRTLPRRGNNRLIIAKYFGREGRTDGIVDFKVFRTAEMYLIRAEAALQNGDEAGALADLNTLRKARKAGVGVETGSGLQQAIMDERRKELVLEGQRFFDLKRTTRTINRITDCTEFCNLPPEAREWNFPIPQSEIDANPNMVQNPDY